MIIKTFLFDSLAKLNIIKSQKIIKLNNILDLFWRTTVKFKI